MKYSKPKAFTEIELFNPSGSNPLIRREINRDNNNSTWILNGKSSQMKEVSWDFSQPKLILLTLFIGAKSC